MKGIKHIEIYNNRVKYKLEIERNITIINGDSATGKSTLINMLSDYQKEGIDSGVILKSNVPCVVLNDISWKTYLSKIKNSIVFIEEGNRFILSKDFSDFIKNTNNYYVIITRESLPNLPYSISSIKNLVNINNVNMLKSVYASIDQISTNKLNAIDTILVEDSKAGYDFWNVYSLKNNILCETSNGKTKILKNLKSIKNTKILVIADGAAFGSEISKVYEYVLTHLNVYLYLPECFEWIILHSNILRNKKIMNILDNPSDYIESKEFFSWENYFVNLLEKETSKKLFTKYSKKKLNKFYISNKNLEKIISSIDRS